MNLVLMSQSYCSIFSNRVIEQASTVCMTKNLLDPVEDQGWYVQNKHKQSRYRKLVENLSNNLQLMMLRKLSEFSLSCRHPSYSKHLCLLPNSEADFKISYIIWQCSDEVSRYINGLLHFIKLSFLSIHILSEGTALDRDFVVVSMFILSQAL